MIREVSAKPMALKRTHLPNTDWRVEPHAATKSFRVERRQGEAWQLVASFLVQAGECKPEERPLEPPPEPPKPPEPVPAQTKQPPTLKKKKQ